MDSLPPVARQKKNPWTSPSEIILWILFVALIFPAAFVGYAVGHYTSLGKPSATVTVTSTSMPGTVTTPTTTTSATTTSSSGGAQIAAGKALFSSQSCAGCHTFTAAGSSGTVGPNLDNAIAADATAAGMPLAAFIRESITKPSAYIAKGYSDGIMTPTFGTSLTSTQIDDLVAFILSGTQQ